jgi:hypothetical protein
LRAAPAPFVFGLFGPWGCGKSSVVKRLPARMGAGVAFAYFDVWKYEDETLRRGFIKSVAQDLETRGYLRRRYDPTRQLADLDVDESTAREQGFRLSGWGLLRFVALVLISGAVLAFGYWLALQFSVTKKAVEGSGDARWIGSLLTVWFTFMLAQTLGLMRIRTATATRRRIEEPDRFADKFEELLRAVTTRRVVIAIDNLDRCSPERVVEVLGTIKTYLQPLAAHVRRQRFWQAKEGPKDVVFLIAADREALRIHLGERESDVDEYLRKFFNAVLCIRDPVDDDIRKYAESVLGKFSYCSLLSSLDKGLLVHMVCTALRRNPRRIKQFANNLEARWAFLLQSARENHLNPELADDAQAVLMLAKLAIIEDEWHEEFEELWVNPRRLGEWSLQAVQEESSRGTGDFAFFQFLRNSEGVVFEDIHPLLTLHQAQDELALPRFAEFRDATVFGDRSTLDDLLAQASDDQQSDYADRLPEMLREEVQSRHDVAAAVNILASTLQSAYLSRDQTIVRQLLITCVDAPSVCAALIRVDAEGLFRSLDLLSLERRLRILLHFARLDSLIARNLATLESACVAFAGLAEALPAVVLERLREALSQPPVVDNVAACVTLIERYPEVASEACDSKAVALLEESFLAASPVFRFHVARFKAGMEEGYQDHFLELSTKSTQFQQDDPDAFGLWLESLEKAIAVMSAISEAAARTFLSALQSRFSGLTAPRQEVVMAIVGELTSRFPGLSDLSEWFMGELFGDPEAGLAYAERDPSPDALISNLLARLEQLATRGSPQSVVARAGNALLNLRDGRNVFKSSVIARFQADQYEEAWALVQDHLPEPSHEAQSEAELSERQPILSREEIEEFLDVILVRLTQVDASRFRSLAERMGSLLALSRADQVDAFSDALTARLGGADVAMVEAVLDVATSLRAEPAFEPVRETLARHLLGTLSQADSVTDYLMPCVTYLIGERQLLSDDEIDLFAEGFKSWLLHSPTYRLELAGGMLSFAGDPASRKLELVNGILVAEADEPAQEIGRRSELLRAARAMVGRRKSRALFALDKRQVGLEQGGDSDRAVALALTEP